MPKVNLYNIVTNDAYEIPIACDLVGAREAGQFLGLKEEYVWKCTCTGRWSHLRKEKAVIVGTKEDISE